MTRPGEVVPLVELLHRHEPVRVDVNLLHYFIESLLGSVTQEGLVVVIVVEILIVFVF